MIVSLTLPMPPSTHSFPRQAATFSLVAPCISFAIAIFVQPQIRGIRLAMIVFGLLQMLMIISGFVLGIVALAATRWCGRTGIFGKAITGTCVNGLLILLTLVGIPGIIKAANRAKAFRQQQVLSATIFQASQQNNTQAIESILSVNPSLVNAKDTNGWTPLHYAAYSGSINALQTLIKHGADVDAFDRHAQTPLHAAALAGNLAAGKALLKAGANINAINQQGTTPLQIAAYAKRIEFVRMLLEAGANPNECGVSKWTALHSACAAGSMPIVKLLLQHGADINAESTNYWTPLDVATEKKHPALAAFLRSKGAVSSADIERQKHSQRSDNP